MQTTTAHNLIQKGEKHLIWEIEVSDLGSYKPFLGFSLTGDYLLVGITSPDQQNKVDIHSIPKAVTSAIQIPLRLEAVDFPQKGILRFKGISKLMQKWRVIIKESNSGIVYTLKKDASLSLNHLRLSMKNLTQSLPSNCSLKLEIELTPK